MSKELDAHLYIAGDPGRARATLDQMLQADAWRLQWNPDGWSGMASKGSKGMNIAFGAFAQYHEIWFSFASLPDGNTHLRLYRSGSGMAGGLWGMSKVKKNFATVVAHIETTFYNAGVLLNSQGR